jgi:hypothetical protein
VLAGTCQVSLPVGAALLKNVWHVLIAQQPAAAASPRV